MIAWLKSLSPKAIGICLAILAALAVVLWWLSRKHPVLKPLVVASAEAHHTRAIESAKAQAAALSSDANANAAKVRQLEGEIERRKLELEHSYESVDLSSEEIAERFRRLGL